MAADINKVIIVGRLTRDADQSYTQSGYAILKFSIAVSRKRKQGDQWVEEASFFDCVIWGKQGEAIASYMTKGKQVAIEGQLRQDRWEDKNDGSKRSRVTIDANNIQLLGNSHGDNVDSRGNYGSNSAIPPDHKDPAARQPGTPPAANKPAPNAANFEDDIPF